MYFFYRSHIIKAVDEDFVVMYILYSGRMIDCSVKVEIASWLIEWGGFDVLKFERSREGRAFGF